MTDELIDALCNLTCACNVERGKRARAFSSLIAAIPALDNGALEALAKGDAVVVPRMHVELAVACLKTKAWDAARDNDSAAANYINSNAGRLADALAASPYRSKSDE